MAKAAQMSAIEETKKALEEPRKDKIVNQFVQSLFFSLDPQNTSGMDTELLKTMLDQGVKRALTNYLLNHRWKQILELT